MKGIHSTVSHLETLLKVMACCGVCAVSMRREAGLVKFHSSTALKCYCWILFGVVGAGSATTALVLAPAPMLMQYLCGCCEMLLYHAGVGGALLGVTAPRLTAYVDFLNKVDEVAGGVSSGAAFRNVRLWLFAQVALSVADAIEPLRYQVTRAGMWSGILACQVAIFWQLLCVQASFVLLAHIPIIKLRAIEQAVRRLNRTIGLLDDDCLDFPLMGDRREPNISFLGGGDGSAGVSGRLCELALAQEHARDAARAVEDALSSSMLAAVTIAFMKMVFNGFCVTHSLEVGDMWVVTVSSARICIYLTILALICETCQQMYIVDARVTAALTGGAWRASGDTKAGGGAGAGGARLRELWARLRVAASRQPRYTACRVVTLDRALASSAVATAVTYTVMLLQLDSSSNVEDNP